MSIEIRSVLYLIIVFFVITWLRKKLSNYVRSVILAIRLPGPKPNSILGNVELVEDGDNIIDTANQTQHLYGSIYRARLLHIPFFFIYEPEYLKVILNNSKIRADKNFLYSLGEVFLGGGLITNNGQQWKKNRKFIQPYFQLNYLQIYLDSFVECSKCISKNLVEGEYVNIPKFINTAILSALYREVLGLNLDEVEASPFRSNELLIIKRIMQPWLISNFAFKHTKMFKNESNANRSLRDVTKQAMEKRMQLRKTEKVICCLMDMLIEIHENNPYDFTEQDIINESITAMLAGQDSTATFLAFCIFYIAKHPEFQEKIYKEINEIFVDDDTKSITIQQLNKMVYLEQCIKESLRLTPVVPLVFRVVKDDVDLGAYTIPADSNICISPVTTHRLPKYFPDPLRYDPERFSAENVKKIHPFAYIPFSSGPRNCIGSKFAILKAKTIISLIIRKHQLTLKPGTEELHLKYSIVFKAKGGIWVKSKLRTTK